ncbi:MAG: response regulator, partial [Nitrospirae bacterium]
MAPRDIESQTTASRRAPPSVPDGLANEERERHGARRACGLLRGRQTDQPEKARRGEGERTFLMARILVVDDEPMMLDLLHITLTRKGHAVLKADRGRQAIQLFRQDHPDLTILDLNLPDITGIDV